MRHLGDLKDPYFYLLKESNIPFKLKQRWKVHKVACNL